MALRATYVMRHSGRKVCFKSTSMNTKRMRGGIQASWFLIAYFGHLSYDKIPVTSLCACVCLYESKRR